MLAERFANVINRHWLWLLVGWVVLAGGLKLVAPSWDAIAKDGDLEYLPREVPSLTGKRLLEAAFPNEKAQSQAVVVFSRGGEPLLPEDRQFALAVADRLRGTPGIPLVDLWDENTQVVGDMLKAKGDLAVMVVARLTSGLMDVDNARLLELFKETLASMRGDAPEGLEVGLTGSGLIGGDLRASIEESLASTEVTTVLLVLGCLIVIYRAPLLVLIPLATIAVSMSVSYDVVALLADNFGPDDYSWSDFKIFTTTKIFVVVILFGAGTDFCLFLIARYKEELAAGAPRDKAVGQSLVNVSDALIGSAFTTILGLSTMALAQYGKFVSSGPIVAVCLFIALVACMTFAPALLRMMGPLVFWPFGKRVVESDEAAALQHGGGLWGWIADLVMRRPATILMLTAWLTAPLIVIGAQARVTHDFMADLAPDRTSVVGAKQAGRYYGEGALAPMTVVAQLAQDAKLPDGAPLDLNTPDGRYAIAPLHQAVFASATVADVRSLYLPTGGDPKKKRFLGGSALHDLAVAGSPITAETFVSHTEPYAGKVTQLAVLLADDPFSKTARDRLPELRASLDAFTAKPEVDGQPNPWKGARLELVGTTPGMRDLELVTNSDRTRIQLLTVGAVYLVLLVLLRRPLVCLYLIVTVLLSYYVTMGLTGLFFEWFYGDTYNGLDWKLPIFLFVILVAIGQDYNIYLATRVYEEQRKHGLRDGLRRAIVQTGGIITSCGVIMAGTFFAMATGTLRGMIELGFALALGVLIDTFFVRTIVVPCFFALLARREKPEATTPPAAPPTGAQQHHSRHNRAPVAAN